MKDDYDRAHKDHLERVRKLKTVLSTTQKALEEALAEKESKETELAQLKQQLETTSGHSVIAEEMRSTFSYLTLI